MGDLDKALMAAQRQANASELRTAQRYLKIMTGVSISSSTVAALAIVALLAVASLKEIHAFVLEVDKVTGENRVLTTIDRSSMTEIEALAKERFYAYIRCYNRYDRYYNAHCYELVELMSSDHVFARYAVKFNKDIPGHVYEIYGARRVTAAVTSMNKIDVDVMRIFFTVNVSDKETGKVIQSTDYVGEARWAYEDKPRPEKDRWKESLGFKVIDWNYALSAHEEVAAL